MIPACPSECRTLGSSCMRDLLFAHPHSHLPLTKEEGGFRSKETGEFFPLQEGKPSFLPPEARLQERKERSDFVNRVKTFLRASPHVYLFLVHALGPAFCTGFTARKFVRQFPEDARVLNVGSGVHRYRKSMVNLDIFPYAGVDVVADATALPFPDGSFEGALSECLLEHVPRPVEVVREIVRILRPGGRAFISAPFIFPFHACPNDYYRWSITGMRELCKEAGAEIISIASRSGPTSALVAQLATWCAIALSFGSTKLYHILSMVLLIPFAPLRLLDLILGRLPTALHGTEGFYVVIRKPSR